MKGLQRLVVAVVFLLGVTMCSTSNSEKQASAPAADVPTRGGRVVIAEADDPAHLNPAITTAGHTVSEMLYNGLLRKDERGQPQPDLAESWTVEQNGAVYRFMLRSGVRWHDGKPFSSNDVKFSFEEVLLKHHARTRASMANVVEAIEAPDDRTVVFRFKQPYAPFLYQLDTIEAPIVPKHVFEGTDPLSNPANSKPIGTGPFRFGSYDRGSEIRFVRNPDYFKRDLPYLDEVVIRIIPDAGTRLLALERGEADFLWDVSGPDRSRLKASGNFETFQSPLHPGGGNGIVMFGFNLSRAMLSEVRVRRAIAHSVDQKRIVDQVLFGDGKVPAAPISSGIPWAHASGVAMPRFDRVEAERLLDAVGWKKEQGRRVARGVPGVPDSTSLSLDLLHWPTFATYGELIRQELAAVGIEVTLKALDPATFASTVFRNRDFDTFVVPYSNGPDPEIGVRRLYHSSQIGPVPYTNGAGYRNSRVDALFDQAVQTLDPANRTRLYREIQEILVQELPYHWLVELETTRFWRKGCTGFQPWTGLFAEAAYCKP